MQSAEQTIARGANSALIAVALSSPPAQNALLLSSQAKGSAENAVLQEAYPRQMTRLARSQDPPIKGRVPATEVVDDEGKR